MSLYFCIGFVLTHIEFPWITPRRKRNEAFLTIKFLILTSIWPVLVIAFVIDVYESVVARLAEVLVSND